MVGFRHIIVNILHKGDKYNNNNNNNNKLVSREMGRSEDRIPSGPPLCIVYRVSFPEVKRSGCALITHPYLAPRLSCSSIPVCVFNGMLRSDCYCKVLHYLHPYIVTLLYYLPAISVIVCEVDVDQLIQRIIYIHSSLVFRRG